MARVDIMEGSMSHGQLLGMVDMANMFRPSDKQIRI